MWSGHPGSSLLKPERVRNNTQTNKLKNKISGFILDTSASVLQNNCAPDRETSSFKSGMLSNKSSDVEGMGDHIKAIVHAAME